MYTRILVPLDGSELAEIALPHAVAVAKQSGAAVRLLRVLPTLPPAVLPEGAYLDWEQIQRDAVAEARSYLEQVRGRLAAEGLDVATELRTGEAADVVIETARELGADLIVMATHGRSGLGRWVLGSVADRVVRAAHVPVLLIRPEQLPAE